MPTSRSSFGLLANGNLYAWGSYITSGTNSTANIFSPIQVVGNHRFIMVEASYEHTMALKDNGQVWVWGLNTYGQFGNGSYGGGTSSPVQTIGNHSFIQIYSGYQSSAALKEDGKVWTWGRNNYGQLGANYPAQSINSPIQTVGNHSFVRLYGASELYFGIKQDNECWSWGRNEFGQLGDNTVVNKSSPVRIVGNHSFIDIKSSGYHTLGLKANGEVWAWGVNSWGQLGTNNITNYSSPVRVVGNHSFIAIAAEYNGSSYGLKTNGEIWSWGYNASGQLGTNNITNYSSPVRVVGNHSFIGLQTCSSVAKGLKANGQIWSWGYNADGRCGTSGNNSYSSPVLAVGPMSYTKLLSGMSIPVNVSGSWRKRSTIFVNINNTWYRVKDIWILKKDVWNKTDNFNK
jgi:alpha-tubulin suppressor-like RCC1 family protein